VSKEFKELELWKEVYADWGILRVWRLDRIVHSWDVTLVQRRMPRRRVNPFKFRTCWNDFVFEGMVTMTGATRCGAHKVEVTLQGIGPLNMFANVSLAGRR
jgi:hypothetical protein